MESQNEDQRAPLLGSRASRSLSQRQPSPHPASPTSAEQDDEMEFKDLSRKSQWIALAVMSGACAAFNGVFAKLYVMLSFHIRVSKVASLHRSMHFGNARYMYAPEERFRLLGTTENPSRCRCCAQSDSGIPATRQ
jgi:hypothetical protein